MVDRAVKSGDLATLDTVAAEIRDNAMTASEPAARRAVATTDINDEIVDDALAKFGRPYARFGTRDIRTCLEMIDACTPTCGAARGWPMRRPGGGASRKGTGWGRGARR